MSMNVVTIDVSVVGSPVGSVPNESQAVASLLMSNTRRF